MPPPNQCFVSYAHADRQGFERLCVHLTPVAALLGFNLWHDKRIHAGDYWNHRIEAEIARSQIFVLLATPDFFASGYILKHELPAILGQHGAAGALVLPVIYQQCGWKGFFGSFIQVVPTDDAGRLRAVRDWPRPENGLHCAAEAIQAAVVDWFGIAPRSPMAALGVPTP